MNRDKIKWYGSWLGYIFVISAFFITNLLLNPITTDRPNKGISIIQGYFESLSEGLQGNFGSLGAFISMTFVLVIIPYIIGYFIQYQFRKSKKEGTTSLLAILGIILFALLSGNFLSLYSTQAGTTYDTATYYNGVFEYANSGEDELRGGTHVLRGIGAQGRQQTPHEAYFAQGYPKFPEPRTIAAKYFSHILGDDNEYPCSFGSCSFVEYPDAKPWVQQNIGKVASLSDCMISGTVVQMRANYNGDDRNPAKIKVPAMYYEALGTVGTEDLGGFNQLVCILDGKEYIRIAKDVLSQVPSNLIGQPVGYGIQGNKFDEIVMFVDGTVKFGNKGSFVLTTPVQPIAQATEESNTEAIIAGVVVAVLLVLLILFFVRRRR